MLNFIIRITHLFQSTTAIKSLYFAYVLSKLEYAVLVWFPYYAYQQLALDRVHRRFLKFLSFKLDRIYPARGTDQLSLLERHGMSSLTIRREISTAKFPRLLLHGQIDAPLLLSRVQIHVPRQASRFPRTFQLPSSHSDVLQRSPISTMSRNANMLFEDIFL